VTPFYFNHWNRWPLYQATQGESGEELELVEYRVQTTGVTVAKTAGPMTTRGEVAIAYRVRLNRDDFSQDRTATNSQAVFELDRSSGASQVGAKLQVDSWHPQPDVIGKPLLVWMGALAKTAVWRRSLVPELMAYRGINNSDTWVKLKLAWTAPASFGFSTEADWVLTAEDGNPLYFEPQRRIFSRLTYGF